METTQSSIQRFAHTTSTPERLALLRQIMAEKQVKAFVSAPEFSKGLLAIASAARAGTSPSDRLLAIDCMIRIWNSSVPATVKGEIENFVRTALGEQLPPLAALNELQESGVDKPSDSRFNVVLALDMSDADWISDYRLKNLVEEDKSPRVRQELAKQILRRGDALESLLNRIAGALSDKRSSWRQRTEANRRRLR